MKKALKLTTKRISVQLLTSLIVLFTAIAFAQEPVRISGTFDREAVELVKLFAVAEGSMVEIASAKPQLHKKFGFKFYPEYEGFYAIGSGTTGHLAGNNIFYFKAGDQLELTINKDNYVLIGTNNSEENKILKRWHEVINPIEQKAFYWGTVSSTFVDFFPELEAIIPKADTFIQNNRSGNAKFDAKLKDYIQWDIAANATNFLNTPRSAHPAVDEYPDYYSSLKLSDFAKIASTVYEMPWGKRSLTNIASLERKIANIRYENNLNFLQTIINLTPNDTLRGDIVLDYLAQRKEYKTYKEVVDKFESYILTTSQKARATTIKNDLAQLDRGGQGLPFSFPDNNGDIVNSENLKGKVVLIDVWATWCGPCRDEIPHLKKLAEEMRGTDVQVVSISVDDEKDKAKWQKMIKDEQLGGLQLLAPNRGDDFMNYYKIDGIPRFMVFDREGKIVTTDAPRPSNPELKQLLEEVLAGK